MLDLILGVLILFASILPVLLIGALVHGLILRGLCKYAKWGYSYRANPRLFDLLFDVLALTPTLLVSYFLWGGHLVSAVVESLFDYSSPYIAFLMTALVLLFSLPVMQMNRRVRHEMLEEGMIPERREDNK
jgi:hypothetical protein